MQITNKIWALAYTLRTFNTSIVKYDKKGLFSSLEIQILRNFTMFVVSKSIV